MLHPEQNPNSSPLFKKMETTRRIYETCDTEVLIPQDGLFYEQRDIPGLHLRATIVGSTTPKHSKELSGDVSVTLIHSQQGDVPHIVSDWMTADQQEAVNYFTTNQLENMVVVANITADMLSPASPERWAYRVQKHTDTMQKINPDWDWEHPDVAGRQLIESWARTTLLEYTRQCTDWLNMLLTNYYVVWKFWNKGSQTDWRVMEPIVSSHCHNFNTGLLSSLSQYRSQLLRPLRNAIAYDEGHELATNNMAWYLNGPYVIQTAMYLPFWGHPFVCDGLRSTADVSSHLLSPENVLTIDHNQPLERSVQLQMTTHPNEPKTHEKALIEKITRNQGYGTIPWIPEDQTNQTTEWGETRKHIPNQQRAGPVSELWKNVGNSGVSMGTITDGCLYDGDRSFERANNSSPSELYKKKMQPLVEAIQDKDSVRSLLQRYTVESDGGDDALIQVVHFSPQWL